MKLKLKSITNKLLIICLIFILFTIFTFNTFSNNISYKTMYSLTDLFMDYDIVNETMFNEYKDYDIDQFKKNYIDVVYFYDKQHDCKYWTNIWSKYLDYNDINYKFINTNNHIFIIAFSDSGYIVLDQNNLYKNGDLNG